MNYSTASTAQTKSLTLQDIERMAQVLASFPPCPLTAWMVNRGHDPAQGWLLVLPEALRDDIGPFPPKWVRFSAFITAPVAMNPRAAGLG